MVPALPDWWTWDISVSSHAELRMEQRGVTEVECLIPDMNGVLRGKAEIARFLEAGARKRPIDLLRFHRSDTYFSAGTTLIWEYPRQTPEEDQVEIVEVMEISDRLIHHHRIYWGWKGCLLIAPNLVRLSG